ncbi:MAG: alpha/beta hydrolase [Candidatus Saccharibacteria bacterium]|nr:alpha/beta hydrolase [Candidatus Saccharibacteria bacterium]
MEQFTSVEETYTFVLIHGAWHGSSHWQPLQAELTTAGQKTIAPELPAEDPGATFDDDTAAVRDSIADRENLFLVVHSRGVETLPRVLDQLDLARVVGALVLCSGGPRDFELNIPSQYGKLQRNTDEFRSGITTTADGLFQIYDPQTARKVFYADVSQTLTELAVRGLRKQRIPCQREAELPPMPQEIPTWFMLGTQDRALNLDRARLVSEEWLGPNALLEFPTGHTPQLAKPAELGQLLLYLANLARVQRRR